MVYLIVVRLALGSLITATAFDFSQYAPPNFEDNTGHGLAVNLSVCCGRTPIVFQTALKLEFCVTPHVHVKEIDDSVMVVSSAQLYDLRMIRKPISLSIGIVL